MSEFLPQNESELCGKISEQDWLNKLQMVQFECLGHESPGLLSLRVNLLANEGDDHRSDRIRHYDNAVFQTCSHK